VGGDAAGTEVVVNNQAFAWNPSIRGGKVEDTVILHDGVIENLTATPELPVLDRCSCGRQRVCSGWRAGEVKAGNRG
jgi:Xaa-Pro dipeptidase